MGCLIGASILIGGLVLGIGSIALGINVEMSLGWRITFVIAGLVIGFLGLVIGFTVWLEMGDDPEPSISAQSRHRGWYRGYGGRRGGRGGRR